MTHSKTRGFALALVLIMIVLALTIATVFLASTSRERKSVDLYGQESQVRNLSDMAVSRVMGEINTATREGTATAPVSWASQPGMIRTYNAAGTANNVYKLYSWDSLVEPGTGFQPGATNEVPTSDWFKTPAMFTDLNAPANGVYPIVDPTAVYNVGNNTGVQGFSIDSTDTSYHVSTATTPNTAPMPVKWLYVLEDGQMVPGTTPGTNTVTVAGAGATNKIVGRVAFWTDDETSKVNVNTAGEGEFWDWPKGGSADEMQFAGNPPVRGEYQRVPGHPGTTSLSGVFPEMSTTTRWTGASLPASVNTNYQTEQSKIFGVTPRYQWGGSQGGTVPISTYGYNYAPPKNQGNATALPSDRTDRLFVDPQELLFNPARTRNTYFSLSNASLVTPDQLRQRDFFLTASSRAPETNLYEQPRISLWPITWPNPSSYFYFRTGNTVAKIPAALDPNKTPITKNKDNQNKEWMTPTDKLLAFCASLQKPADLNGITENRYFIQRRNPDSPTDDWNNIARNSELFDKYLFRLTGTPVPGFGMPFAAGREFILAKIFDYSRSCINQYTPIPYSTTAPSGGAGPQAALQYSFTGFTGNVDTVPPVGPSVAGATFPEPQAFSVVPIKTTINGGTQHGLGAFPRIKEAALVFYATNRVVPLLKDDVANLNPPPAALPDPTDVTDPSNWNHLIKITGAPDDASQTTTMRAVLLFDFVTDLPGAVSASPTFWIYVKQGSFTINGQKVDLTGRSVQWSPLIGSNSGPHYPALYKSQSKQNVAAPPDAVAKTFDPTIPSKFDNWSLISIDIPVTSTSTTFPFSVGTPLQLEFYGPEQFMDSAFSHLPANLFGGCTIDFTPWATNANPTTGSFAFRNVLNVPLPNGQLPTPLAPTWTSGDCPPAASPEVPWHVNYGNTKKLPDPMYSDPAYHWVGAEFAPALSANVTLGPEKASPLGTPSGATGFHAGYNMASYFYPFTMDFQNRVTYADEISSRAVKLKTFYTLDASNFTYSSSVGASDDGLPLISPYDTVISMVLDPTQSNAGSGGDPRVIELVDQPKSFVRSDTLLLTSTSTPREMVFNRATTLTTPTYPNPHTNPRSPRINAQFHTLGSIDSSRFASGIQLDQSLLPVPMGIAAIGQAGGDGQALLGSRGDYSSMVKPTMLTQVKGVIGDWSSAPGGSRDGGSLVRPDQDYQIFHNNTNPAAGYASQTPYFADQGLSAAPVGVTPDGKYATSFSPNRQVPSPVILGSIPRSTTLGWQTLAFSPNPANPAHPGLASASKAPDHLWLDLFWMPVAEPYPMSDQLSTAGKVNLNYQIAPFSYIKRQTALYAALKSTWISATPYSGASDSEIALDYKSPYYMNPINYNPAHSVHGALINVNNRTRYPIHLANTLNAFDYKFSHGDIFHSASQICEMFLYPGDPANPSSPLVTADTPPSTTQITAWWTKQGLTSDTAREQPYDHLYSRVTTKSNTFTVHWRVQSLGKVPSTDAGVWDEVHDRVLADKRGSSLIERYIDPNVHPGHPELDIPDYATDPNPAPLSNYYKWRVVSEHFFQPSY